MEKRIQKIKEDQEIQRQTLEHEHKLKKENISKNINKAKKKVSA